MGMAYLLCTLSVRLVQVLLFHSLANELTCHTYILVGTEACDG